MRLIDADALKEDIAKKTPHFAQRIAFTPCFEAIRNAPTVDAVQVVRCKDCAKRGTINCTLDYCGYRQSDNWYCADGESLEEDDLRM